jgi:hypothetical protein
MARALHLMTWTAVVVAMCSAQSRTVAAPLRAVDLDGTPFDLARASEGATAAVFIFTAIECPISNRYAPEIQRIATAFRSRGVRTWLVFANSVDQPAAIRTHMTKFGLTLPALRDPAHDLVRLAGATISPEAAVLDRRGRVRYHGRIDDRWVEFGRDRPAPTKRDLEDAIAAVLEGRPIPEPVTQAVGCYLSDFK